MFTPVRLQMQQDEVNGCRKCRGSEGFSYPGIRAVFRVASSEDAHGCLEVPVVDIVVDVCIVLVCCHLGRGWKAKKGHKETTAAHARQSPQSTGGNFGCDHVAEVT